MSLEESVRVLEQALSAIRGMTVMETSVAIDNIDLPSGTLEYVIAIRTISSTDVELRIPAPFTVSFRMSLEETRRKLVR